jgi:hypothetical protein
MIFGRIHALTGSLAATSRRHADAVTSLSGASSNQLRLRIRELPEPCSASRTALRSFGGRRRATRRVSFTYLQAVVVPTPNPAGTSANVVRSAAWLQYEFLEESSPLICDLIGPFG